MSEIDSSDNNSHEKKPDIPEPRKSLEGFDAEDLEFLGKIGKDLGRRTEVRRLVTLGMTLGRSIASQQGWSERRKAYEIDLRIQEITKKILDLFEEEKERD